jgi:ribosome maturation factor RimP
VPISRAHQITPEFHRSHWYLFEKALALFQQSSNQASLSRLRFRDWWMFVEEGVPCLDLFLDEGHATDPKAPNQLRVLGQLDLEALQAFHTFLLETDLFDAFGDDIEIRIGSPGAEPYLRVPEDFAPWLGCMLHLETWTKRENRDRYTMLLARFEQTESPVALPGAANAGDQVEIFGNVVLQEGSKSFVIPLHDVKFAQALPFHSESFQRLAKKKPGRK